MSQHRVNDMASNDSDGKKSLSNPPKGGDYSKDIEEVLNKFFEDSHDNISYPTEAGFHATQSILDILDKARADEIKKIWGHAREHTITDIEMISHHTNGQVDFIEAVETKYLEERLKELGDKQ